MRNSKYPKQHRRQAYQPVNTQKKSKVKKKKLVVDNVTPDVVKESLKGERRGVNLSKLFYYLVALIGLACVILNITDPKMHLSLGVFNYDGSLVGVVIIVIAIWRAEKADKYDVEIRNVSKDE